MTCRKSLARDVSGGTYAGRMAGQAIHHERSASDELAALAGAVA
jgi:hypothetical protein